MELEHFSHEHPLILNEEKKYDVEEFGHCNGCLEQIISGGPYYCCSECKFSLHKLCAELPREMEHPMHPRHPLTLLARRDCICNICRREWNDFTYYCSLCDFDIDVICASLMERKIEHKSHKHPLITLPRPASLFCYACGTEHKGIFYFCTTCGLFWINRDCASLPSTVKHSDHDHPLALNYSLPHEHMKFGTSCDICSEELNEPCWFYYCAGCRYLAHVNCATSKIEAFMSILLPDRKTKTIVEDPNLIHLPLLDESVSLISHFLKEMNVVGENKRELNHFSHDHPLILFDHAQSSNDEENKPSIPNEMKKNKLCDGCAQPILTPLFYTCPQCNFCLHKWCAELPTELQHPCHPQHPLLLLAKSPQFFGLFYCKGCGRDCNGFTFSCSSCQFYLDVNCASLPGAITHEAHAHHRLVLRKKLDGTCNACRFEFEFEFGFGFGFGCDTCDFKLHAHCAMLPPNVSHRYEEHHPLTLTYSPINDHSDEYFCEICEEDVNPKAWFYHSGDCDCDQWFHPQCIHPTGTIVEFGGTIKITSHPHLLTLVPKSRYDSDSGCDLCGMPFWYFLVAFQCSQCNYKLDHYCAAELCSEQSS